VAAATITAIMDGIETRLLTISGLRVSEVIPGQINPPHAIVGCPPIPKYHATMGMGHMQLDFTVTVLVSSTIDRVGQRKLADYANPAGSQSIRAAIEGDRTLGGAVSDCIVTAFEPLGLEDVGQLNYFGGVFTLQVIALGA
jgi:hypothetical protein